MNIMKPVLGIILLLCCMAAAQNADSSHAENPFLSSGDQTESAAEQRVVPREVNPPWWYPIVIWQKSINDKLASSLAALKEGFSVGKVLLVFIVSLVYSMLHTAGPGHGKVILGTYFLTSSEKRKKIDAAIAGIIVSLTHVGMAFILSLFLWIFLNTLSMSSQRDMANVSRRIGGIFVVITGLAILVTCVLSNRTKLFSGERFKGRMKSVSLYGIAVLSGIVPCPLAWFVLVFSISYGIYAYGILSIVGMAIGAAITVGTTGLLVLVGRDAAMNVMGTERSRRIALGLRAFGGVVLLLFGAIMVAAS